MAEASSMPIEEDASQYWCYRCDKHVLIETHSNLTDIVCLECGGGFVESVTGSEQFHLIRSRDSLPQDAYISFDLDEWNDDDRFEPTDEIGDGEDPSDEEIDDTDLERGIEIGRRLREVIGMQIREMASRSRSGLVDWEELSGIFDGESMQSRFRSILHRYATERGNFLDEDEFEALLQNFAESDGGGRRGAPPAAKTAIESLETLEIEPGMGDFVCAICKDGLDVGDTVKKLPCGHGYHGGCITPWLSSRNSCPVCRFELPTDDLTYEEEKKKKKRVMVSEEASGSGSGNWPM